MNIISEHITQVKRELDVLYASYEVKATELATVQNKIDDRKCELYSLTHGVSVDEWVYYREHQCLVTGITYNSKKDRYYISLQRKGLKYPIIVACKLDETTEIVTI